MESEKVKEIKKALEDNANYEHHDKLGYIDGYKCKTVDYADILTLINELESENETIKLNIQETEKASFNINQMNGNLVLENQVLKDRIAELESKNKELRVVTDIANERTYRKKFTDEWRKEYQKELDKQGNGHIAGHPDFDLVYKLYFEQKDRIAELEKEVEDRKAEVLHLQEYGKKLIRETELKQFAEKLKEKLEEYRLENEYFIKDELNGNLWQLNSSVFYLEVTQDGGLVDATLKEYEK